MLDLYYHLHDEDSREAMRALAGKLMPAAPAPEQDPPAKGNLRAKRGSQQSRKRHKILSFKSLWRVY